MKKSLLILFAVFFSFATAFAQDIIVMRNSTEIKAKIKNIGQNEITYSKWSNQDGPTYTINKSDVRYIQYANGEKDVFENTRPTASYSGGNNSYSGSYSAANSNSNTNTNTQSYGNTTTGKSNNVGVGSVLTGMLTGNNYNNSNTSVNTFDDNSNKARFRGYFYGDFAYATDGSGAAIAPIIEMGAFCGGNTFIGILTGFKYFPDYSVYFIPVDLTARFYFTKTKFAPFADACVGIAIGSKVVFNARVGIGFNAGKFMMGVGYERLYTANLPFLKIGFNFGK